MRSAQSLEHFYTDLRTFNRPMIMTVIYDHGSSARKDLSSHASAHGSGACYCDYGTSEFLDVICVLEHASTVQLTRLRQWATERVETHPA